MFQRKQNCCKFVEPLSLNTDVSEEDCGFADVGDGDGADAETNAEFKAADTGNGGVCGDNDAWRASCLSIELNCVKSDVDGTCDVGEGGVDDARGDARDSEAIDALGVGVFGDGINNGGDCVSGIPTNNIFFSVFFT